VGKPLRLIQRLEPRCSGLLRAGWKTAKIDSTPGNWSLQIF